jgi:hypothetical protein
MGFYTLLKVLLFLAVIAVAFLYYLGYWDPQEARKVALESLYFMYFDAQCNYKDLGKLFSRLENDIDDSFDEGEFFCAGAYFDDPNMVAQPHMTRSAIGIIPITD